MRGAGITELGGAVQALDLAPPRPLRADEVLIAVRAAGVGNWDEFVRSGAWDVGRAPPLALGVEAAGVIVAVGAAVDRYHIGDEVMGHAVPLRDQGAWAAQHVLPVASIASKPPEVRWQVAGAIAVPSLTALQALDEALGVRPGETLVVHGGGGVTGRLVVQLAVDRGLRVIATAGPSSAAKVAGYGAMAVLDYHDANWAVRAIAETAGQGADAAVNAVPGGAATALRALRPGGRLATITGDPPRANGFAISNVYVRPDGDQLAEALQLVARGRLTIDVAVSEPLARAADALDAVVSRRAGGAVVIEPDSP